MCFAYCPAGISGGAFFVSLDVASSSLASSSWFLSPGSFCANFAIPGLAVSCHHALTWGAVVFAPFLDTRREREGITGVLIADIVLQLLSYVAQVERENIKARQREGIETAKARGVRFGRPRKRRPGIYKQTKQAYLEGHITRSEAATRLKVCACTFDKWLREDAGE